MTQRIVIECGAAETRAALMINDVVWRFAIAPARGDEASDKFPYAGRRFVGRVVKAHAALNAVFVDIGDGRDAYLAVGATNKSHLHESALIEVEIKSPPRQSKGAVLRFLAVAKDDAVIGHQPPFEDPVLEVARALGCENADICIDDGDALRCLVNHGYEKVLHESTGALFLDYGLDEALDAAFERRTPVSGGGSIVIDETEAFTAIDVDTGAQEAASSSRLREKVAIAAAGEAIRQISLRNIGGHVVIDFPVLGADVARKKLAEKITKDLKNLHKARAASFSKSGLFSFQLPRNALSLLDRFTEKDAGEPVAGRCYTVDALAKSAIRALETQLRLDRSGSFSLELVKKLSDHINARPAWTARLRERYGGRFEVKVSEKQGEAGFDVSEQ